MKDMKYNYYFIEVTDTFGGEANYAWARRYIIRGKSRLGAIQRLSRQTGGNWRYVGADRYNSLTGCTCLFTEELGDGTQAPDHNYTIDDRV